MRPMGRIMGVDLGSVRIGVALSDEGRVIARPLQTVRRTGDRTAVKALARIAADHAVSRILVGLPLLMSGEEPESARDARRLAGALRAATGIEVEMWDERLTTVQAERALLEGDVSRARRREVIDRVAAAVMLQSYLDSLPAGAPPTDGDEGPR